MRGFKNKKSSPSDVLQAQEEAVKQDFRELARMLTLLREYQTRFGMPNNGGAGTVALVLQELCKRLYASGVPIWVLEPAMGIAAQGLTGGEGVGFFLLPSSGIILPNDSNNNAASGISQQKKISSTRIFRMERNYCMFRMTLLEHVLNRLGSFRNTHTVATLNSVVVQEEDKGSLVPKTLMQALSTVSANNGEQEEEESVQDDGRNDLLSKALLQAIPTTANSEQQDEALNGNNNEAPLDRQALAKEILDYSARGYGLFFLSRIEELLMKKQHREGTSSSSSELHNVATNTAEGNIGAAESGNMSLDDDDDDNDDDDLNNSMIQSFWKVEPSCRELFSRLATLEAAESMDAIERLPGRETLYPKRWIVLFRAIGSAGSSALWFHGSWLDMLIAGLLAGLVAAVFQLNKGLWRNKRMIFEVIVGFVVGLTAGLISIAWPTDLCFHAIAIPSMIDYLRGFGIAFAVMEVMGKDTMSGSADFIEAVVFSFLISASIIFGLFVAESVMRIDDSHSKEYMDCVLPVDELWYILILPIASVGWAGFFRPRYSDLPLMAFHAVLTFAVNWAIDNKTENSFLSSFVAAFTVAVVAGVISRFTGRQALGNTFTGLYTLVPGIFIVDGIFAMTLDWENADADSGTLFISLLLKAITIGVGAWTGSLLIAPTSLDTSSSAGKTTTMLII